MVHQNEEVLVKARLADSNLMHVHIRSTFEYIHLKLYIFFKLPQWPLEFYLMILFLTA